MGCAAARSSFTLGRFLGGHPSIPAFLALLALSLPGWSGIHIGVCLKHEHIYNNRGRCAQRAAKYTCDALASRIFIVQINYLEAPILYIYLGPLPKKQQTMMFQILQAHNLRRDCPSGSPRSTSCSSNTLPAQCRH